MRLGVLPGPMGALGGAPAWWALATIPSACDSDLAHVFFPHLATAHVGELSDGDGGPDHHPLFDVASAHTDRPQRVTLPTLQILAAFMSDLSRDDWYGRALSVHTGLGSSTVLQCLYRLENWGWLESRWEDRDVATRDGRPPRRFYRLTGVAQQEATALLAERFKGQLRFAPGGGVG